MAPGGGGNIKVVVRVRPFNSRGEWKVAREEAQKETTIYCPSPTPWNSSLT